MKKFNNFDFLNMLDLLSPEQPQSLTLDMIKPINGDLIPVDGIFREDDLSELETHRQQLLNCINNRPEGEKVIIPYAIEKNYLNYIAKKGFNPSEYLKIMETVNDHVTPGEGENERLTELELISNAFMNYAEALRRRFIMGKEEELKTQALEALEKSLEYRKKAEELRQKIQEAQNQR